MARFPRRDSLTGIQHVFHRGSRRGTIFGDDDDRKWFIRELPRTATTFHWLVLDYCVMPNHFHLIVQATVANLSAGMQRFGTRHAIRHHLRHGTDGHLFDGRFGSVPVNSEAHFLHLFRYLAANPVNAGLCNSPEEYPWSGHRALAAGIDNGVLAVAEVNSRIAVAAGVSANPYQRLFAPDWHDGPCTNAIDMFPPRPPIADLIERLGRDEAIIAARHEHGYRVCDIAAATNLSPSAVSRRTSHRTALEPASTAARRPQPITDADEVERPGDALAGRPARSGSVASMAATELPPIDNSRDLGQPEFWMRPAIVRDEVFADLRRDHPVSRHNPPPDLLETGIQERSPFWAIVRHEDIRRISRDPKRFCSGKGVQFGDAPPEMIEATQSFLAMDAPRHTKLRKLVATALAPRQVKRIEDGIRANAKRIVAEAAPTGGGEFVELIAKRLPLVTISDMIGVPEADRERVVEAADTVVTAIDPEVLAGRSPLVVLGTAIGTLHSFASELAAERAQRPRDDLMTALVEAEVDGERLTHSEIAAFFVLLSVAGNDTSRHTTSHAMRALTLNPEQASLLRSNLTERMPLAVEEFVRWATPVMTFRRTTTCEVELHGQVIPADEKLVLFYPSGNRDERVFERPWDFDISRSPNPHVGFGGGGPHFCLGAFLARMQLSAIFTEIFTQIPDIQAGEPELFEGGAFIHGVKRLPCEFTKRA